MEPKKFGLRVISDHYKRVENNSLSRCPSSYFNCWPFLEKNLLFEVNWNYDGWRLSSNLSHSRLIASAEEEDDEVFKTFFSEAGID